MSFDAVLHAPTLTTGRFVRGRRRAAVADEPVVWSARVTPLPCDALLGWTFFASRRLLLTADSPVRRSPQYFAWATVTDLMVTGVFGVECCGPPTSTMAMAVLDVERLALAEDRVLAVEERGRVVGDEELRAVGVRAAVGHAEQARA